MASVQAKEAMLQKYYRITKNLI